jgi:urease accessory protein
MIALQPTLQDVYCEEPSWSRIEVVQAGGVSRMIVNQSVGPLCIHNPRVPGSSCHALLANYGGGLVDGDSVSLEILCKEGARLILSSVGSLQVYSSPVQGALQRVRGIVEPKALAVVIPDPVVLHSGAVYKQKQEWHVAPDADLLVAELMVGGRLETGERFTFNEYAAETSIYVAEELVLFDSFVFRPSTFNYTDPAFFAGRSCFLCTYMVGTRWAPLADRLTQLLESSRLSMSAPILAAVHPLEKKGYILRAVADRPRDIAEFLDCICDFVEDPAFLGFNPRKRKY